MSLSARGLHPTLCPASTRLRIELSDDAWANLKAYLLPRNAIVHATDPDGTPVVGVLLSADRTVWLRQEDFQRIDALHPDGRWGVTSNTEGRVYVRIRPATTQQNVYVARLVAGDFERTVVRYRDGDSLNLRPMNLFHDDGGGGRPRRRTLAERSSHSSAVVGATSRSLRT